MLHDTVHADLLIVGCGIAGCAAAFRAAAAGLKVVIVSKEDELEESATKYAQGGIVGKGENDSPGLLINDIEKAGAGASYHPAVRLLASDGPDLVLDFLVRKLDVDFDRDARGALKRTAEAAHSRRRIFHHKDATGRAIIQSCIKAIMEAPGISVFTRHTAVELITTAHHWTSRSRQHENNRCLGAYILDAESGKVKRFLANRTILATGGLGKIFLHTTNPDCATGDGIAMAYRAGARIINAEFIQFHPTAFFHRDSRRFLITEALRGEGARLVNSDGETFMDSYRDEGKDLAPRDVVSRAIYEELARTKRSCVFLDIASFNPKNTDIAQRFPTIHKTLLDYDIDITRKPIPVVPAAHYSCGGVKVDLDGRSELPGLFAVGEVACTGVHGANRLASTSLLEGLLWGWRAAQAIAEEITHSEKIRADLIPPWNDTGLIDVADPLLLNQDAITLRTTMWNYAGIVRTRKRLERAKADMDYLARRVEEFYRKIKLSRQLIELRNSISAARIVIQAALRNTESRGCHFRAA